MKRLFLILISMVLVSGLAYNKSFASNDWATYSPRTVKTDQDGTTIKETAVYKQNGSSSALGLLTNNGTQDCRTRNYGMTGMEQAMVWNSMANDGNYGNNRSSSVGSYRTTMDGSAQ